MALMGIQNQIRASERVPLRAASVRRPKVNGQLADKRRIVLSQHTALEKGRNKTSARANIIFAACLFVVVSSKLWIRIEILDSGYRLETLQQTLISEDAKLRELQSMRSKHLSRGDIVGYASERLALRQTVPQQYRRITY